MDKFLVVLFCMLSLYIDAQNLPEVRKDKFEDMTYFIAQSEANKKLLLFLHGGVENPSFHQVDNEINFRFLVEGNTDFIELAHDNQFDLVMPVTNEQLNWLNDHQQSLSIIKSLVESLHKKYNEIFISGFSDGGTGSYKMFYSNPTYFSGLAVFSGYPQHKNFYRKVQYHSVKNKTIVFLGTLGDKIIPYEFLLTEYCQQKKDNPNTYFYLTDGGHNFSSFNRQDLGEVFDILSRKTINKNSEPIQGFMKNDSLISLYPYRKKIIRKYNYGKEVYEANTRQLKQYKNSTQ